MTAANEATTPATPAPAWTQGYTAKREANGREVLHTQVDGYNVWAERIGQYRPPETVGGQSYMTNGVIMPASKTTAERVISNDVEFGRTIREATSVGYPAPWRPFAGAPDLTNIKESTILVAIGLIAVVAFKIARRRFRS